MSDNFLFIFPRDPNHMPPLSAQELARIRALKIFADADEVEVRNSDLPEFVSALGNFQTVRCPNCHQDILDWWSGAMGKWWNEGRLEFGVTVPCCGASTRLDALDYDWPQGFARFVVSVRNPGRDAQASDLDALAAELGTSVRCVRAHL